MIIIDIDIDRDAFWTPVCGIYRHEARYWGVIPVGTYAAIRVCAPYEWQVVALPGAVRREPSSRTQQDAQ